VVTRAVGALPLFSIAANRRFLLLVALATSLLAGFGLDSILGRGDDAGARRRESRRAALVALGAAALLAVGLVVTATGPPAPGAADPDRAAFAIAQGAGIALLL